MCKCRPGIKTPFCGRPGCTWPPQKDHTGSHTAADGIAPLLETMVLAAYREGGKKNLCARLGISEAMLSMMLNRHKPVPDRIAKAFGFRRRVIYERVTPNA